MTTINKIRRSPKRGHYDRQKILDVLRDNNICHIAVTTEDGPICIPMFYFVYKEKICVHGSKASRLINMLSKNNKCCVAVTRAKGLVLSRSAFHHSMNYQSVVVHGVFEDAAKEDYADLVTTMMESIAKGRSQEVRSPSPEEYAQTKFVCLNLDLAACKERSGPPNEEAEDLQIDTWAGVIPILTSYGEPEPDSYASESQKAKSLKDIINNNEE